MDSLEDKNEAKISSQKPHYHGHRARLRERFLEKGAQSFVDYELLEIILFSASSRLDVKPLAKKLIAEFGGLDGVIYADIHQLRNVPGVSDAAIVAIKAVEASCAHMLKKRSSQASIISSWQSLLDYLHVSLAGKKIEHFRAIFLDKKNKLISDEMQNIGTIDHTPVYPREVVKRALELQASSIILVHNHPSGDPNPSAADIDLTEQIIEAAQHLRINVHDHIIISRSGHFSFKAHGLL